MVQKEKGVDAVFGLSGDGGPRFTPVRPARHMLSHPPALSHSLSMMRGLRRTLFPLPAIRRPSTVSTYSTASFQLDAHIFSLFVQLCQRLHHYAMASSFIGFDHPSDVPELTH